MRYALAVGAIVLFAYQVWLLLAREERWHPKERHLKRAEHPFQFWAAVILNGLGTVGAAWYVIHLLQSN